MFAHPNAFSAQNSHRIALFQPDVARPDLDRIEDIGADAIGTARMAVAYLEELPYETTKPIQGVIRTITTQVERRFVLTDFVAKAPRTRGLHRRGGIRPRSSNALPA